jgi:hypothetical protein
MRVRGVPLQVSLFVALALTGAGCGINNPTYFTPPMGAVESGQPDAGGEVTTVVTLPFRGPTGVESAKLDEESDGLGFRAPWLRRDQVSLSVQYTVTNLDKTRGRAQILVDGANEFSSYDRAAINAALAMQADNRDKPTVLSLIQGIPFEVPAGGSVSGTIREDDFAEGELDLDAIGRWMAVPESVLINVSEVNPVGLNKVPPAEVVPAMFRVAVTLVTDLHMRLDFLVRVRDDKNRLLDLDHAGDAYAPEPKGYTPPPPMAAP